MKAPKYVIISIAGIAIICADELSSIQGANKKAELLISLVNVWNK